jgi:Na+/glutamate symporter
MRLTRFGKFLIVAVVCTALISVIAPSVGLVMAIVLAVVGLIAVAEGFLGGSGGAGGAGGGRETWAQVGADRKREALSRDRR